VKVVLNECKTAGLERDFRRKLQSYGAQGDRLLRIEAVKIAASLPAIPVVIMKML
jgi:hypothetical protein